jgi:hypothetical protein
VHKLRRAAGFAGEPATTSYHRRRTYGGIDTDGMTVLSAVCKLSWPAIVATIRATRKISYSQRPQRL